MHEFVTNYFEDQLQYLATLWHRRDGRDVREACNEQRHGVEQVWNILLAAQQDASPTATTAVYLRRWDMNRCPRPCVKLGVEIFP